MNMIPFYLKRNQDVTGISGTGRVCEGVEFATGQVALSWLSATPSGCVHKNMEAVQFVHGHGGATEVVRETFIGDPYLSIFPKKFHLCHRENRSGMTRVGAVAEVAVFTNGFTAMQWMVAPHQIEFFTALEAFNAVHNHSDYCYLQQVSANVAIQIE